MKYIIGLWVGIGAAFVLPPALYAYAHDDDPLFIAGIYAGIYILFLLVSYGVIRGVNR